MLPSLLYNYSTLNTLALGALIIPALWSLRGRCKWLLTAFRQNLEFAADSYCPKCQSVCTEIQSTGSSPLRVGVEQTLTEHSAVKQSETTVTAD